MPILAIDGEAGPLVVAEDAVEKPRPACFKGWWEWSHAGGMRLPDDEEDSVVEIEALGKLRRLCLRAARGGPLIVVV